MTDLYETLDLARDASPEQVKAAHRRAAKQAHPDMGGDRATFDQVQLAYGILSDASRRAAYDRTGRATNNDPAAALMAKATSHVTQKLMQVLSNPQMDLARMDVVVAIHELIGAEQQQAAAAIAEGTKIMEKLRGVGRRLKFRGEGDDVLAQVIEAQIANVEGQRGQNEQMAQVLAAARELAKTYNYRTDPAPQRTTTWVTMGNPYSTTA